jgi:DHA1 family multidrug resistance protein-like MFS transporter
MAAREPTSPADALLGTAKATTDLAAGTAAPVGAGAAAAPPPAAGQAAADTGPAVAGPGAANWRHTFYALCAVQGVAMLAFGMALPFLPLYVQRLGIADERAAVGWAGLMSSGGMIVMAIMAPIWGSLADRYGRKPMVTRALLGGGTVVALMGLVRSPEQLLALRLVQGAFSGTVAATRTLATSVVPAAELGFVLGMMQTASFIGHSAGPLVGGLVADRFGYRVSFAITGTLLLLTFAGVLRFVHEDFQRPAPATRAGGGVGVSLRQLGHVPGLLALVGTLFFVQAGMSAVSPVLPLFVGSLLPADHGGVATLAGTMLGAGAVTGALAAAVTGKLGDRWGHSRVVAGCALLGGLIYLPQAFVTTPLQLLALRAVQGAFTGGLMPGVMASIALRTPAARRGVVFGLTATATSLGNAAGPLAGAAVAGSFGLRGAFVVTAVVLTLAGLWVGVALRVRPGSAV